MKDDLEIDLKEISTQSDAIQAAVQSAVRQAMLDHKRTGDPIVVWENGAVKWIPADEIVIPEEVSDAGFFP